MVLLIDKNLSMANKLDKINDIINYLIKYDYSTTSIIEFNDSEIDILYNLYFNNIVDIHQDISSMMMIYIAIYYDSINNYEQVKKYYMMAIANKNYYAMINLGLYFENIENDAVLAKKYYQMAVEQNNDYAMIILGNSYFKEGNYDMVKKYYQMAILQNNHYAMNNLGYFYDVIENDYDTAKKYYMMAISQNNIYAMK